MGSASPPSLGPARRCETHALAAGPDGRCALCRSASLPPPRPYPTWVFGGLLAAIVLVSGGAVAYRAATSLAQAAIAQEPPPSRAPDSAVQKTTMPAATAAATPPEAEAIPHQGESIPFNEPVPPPAAPAFADAPPPPAPASAAAAPPAAVPSRPPPTAAELQTALATTPIIMYGASWCGVCRKARQFLAENGLRYQDIDADQAPGGWEKVQELAGRRAVPVIIVDGKVMRGFDPDGVMRAVASSMERRLGVTGISFRR